jgi:hypothetical protein
MRSEILDYLKAQQFTNFNVSDELPYSSSGIPLYMKNLKRIYVDLEQLSNEPIVQSFSSSIDSEIHSVRLYFTTDAKQLPSNYLSVVSSIQAGKNVTTDLDYYRREVNNSTSFENDIMLTEFEFRFTKIT